MTRQDGVTMVARWCVLVLVCALVVGSVVLATPTARAYPTDSGYALTLDLKNGPTFNINDGSAPIFTGTLTVPAGTTPKSDGMRVDVNGTNWGAAFVGSPNGDTYTYQLASDWSWFAIGQYTITANYDLGGTDATPSNQKTVTISRELSTITCQTAVYSEVYAANHALKIVIQVAPANGQVGGSEPAIDWPHATFNVAFTGPQNATYSNLAPDSNGGITVTTPAQVGYYKFKCTFNGTSLFEPSTSHASGITLSLANALAGAQLYTNPTTLQANQNWQAYVVLQAPAGAPTPTGHFDLVVHPCVSNDITVGSDGATLVNFKPVEATCDISHILLVYSGDTYYKTSDFTFPQTNPAIPAGAGSGATGGGGTGQGQATATPKAHATTTATAQGTATAASGASTATPGSAGTVGAATTGTSGGLQLWAIAVAVLVMLVLAGGGGAVLLLARRGSGKTSGGMTSPPQQYTSTQGPWGYRGDYGGNGGNGGNGGRGNYGEHDGGYDGGYDDRGRGADWPRGQW